MSKIAQPTRSGLPRASTSRPSTSARKTSATEPVAVRPGAVKATDKSKKPKKPEFEIPAFSIAPPKPKLKLDWEAIKHDMVRRQAPEGEDVKTIKMLINEMGTNKVPVHEIINIIGPYTADNGAVLRTVMAQDVDSFRKLARKVYETMTQDVSDVLVNEQLHLMQFYEERHDIYTDKMMNAINEIYEMAPNFDFQRFLREKQEYLNMILPLPVDVHKDEAEREMQKRQQAYQRLLWLRSEGERMAAENKSLQKRLQELKSQQDREQQMATEMAAEAETKRRELVEEEANVREQLDVLGKSIEKSFVQNEALANKQLTDEVMSTVPPKKPKKKGPVKKKRMKKPEWVSDVATDIEEQAIQEVIAAEAETVAPAVTVRKPGEPPRQASPPRPLLSPRQRSPQAQPAQQMMPPSPQQPVQQRQMPPPQQQRQMSPQVPPPQQRMQQRQMSPQVPPPQQPMQQRQMSPPQQQRQMSPQVPPPQQPMQQRQMSPIQQPQRSPYGQQPQMPPVQQPQPPMYGQPMQQPQQSLYRQPEQMYQSPQQYHAQQRQETRIEQASTTAQVRRGRRVQGPRDSWGGFF